MSEEESVLTSDSPDLESVSGGVKGGVLTDSKPEVIPDSEQEKPIEEPEAEDKGEEEEPEQDEDSPSSEDDSPAEPPKKKGVQKRIDELTAEKYAEKRRAEALEAELQRYREQAKPETPDVGPKPKLEDFGYDEDKYNAAIEQYYSKKSAAEFEARQRQEMTWKQQQEWTQKQSRTLAQGAATYADFDQVVSQVPISPTAAEAIVISEKGADVAYFLGKNPGEAARINSLPPIQQVYELARIESRLSAPQPKPKTTSAPDPVPTVGGRERVSKSPDKMSYAEYKAARERGEIK